MGFLCSLPHHHSLPKKKKFMTLPTMCGHIPRAVTPATAAADHGHLPNPVMVLTWNDHSKPKIKGCISDQGLKWEDSDLGKVCQNVMWVGPGHQGTGHPPLQPPWRFLSQNAQEQCLPLEDAIKVLNIQCALPKSNHYFISYLVLVGAQRINFRTITL